MEGKAQWRAICSWDGESLSTSVVFVAFAALLAAEALCLLPGLGTLEMAVPGAGRLALAVTVMVLGFSGVLASTLLNLPDTLRRMLVMLFATALLCSGFVALAGWFAVSGASGCWL